MMMEEVTPFHNVGWPVRIELAKKLDLDSHADWRMVAAHLGFSSEDIYWIPYQVRQNSTNALRFMEVYDTIEGACVEFLMAILHDLNRIDVREILERAFPWISVDESCNLWTEFNMMKKEELDCRDNNNELYQDYRSRGAPPQLQVPWVQSVQPLTTSEPLSPGGQVHLQPRFVPRRVSDDGPLDLSRPAGPSTATHDNHPQHRPTSSPSPIELSRLNLVDNASPSAAATNKRKWGLDPGQHSAHLALSAQPMVSSPPRSVIQYAPKPGSEDERIRSNSFSPRSCAQPVSPPSMTDLSNELSNIAISGNQTVPRYKPVSCKQSILGRTNSVPGQIKLAEHINKPPTRIQVLMTYARDSQTHIDAIKDEKAALNRETFLVASLKPSDDVDEKKLTTWIAKADFVLIFVSPTYYQLVCPSITNSVPRGKHANVRYLHDALYRSQLTTPLKRETFIPILVDGVDEGSIPTWLRSTYNYHLPRDRADLHFRLTKPEQTMRRFIDIYPKIITTTVHAKNQEQKKRAMMQLQQDGQHGGNMHSIS